MRSLSLDEKALRGARIDDWCARHRVETQPMPDQRERSPEEIRDLLPARFDRFYGRKKLARADAEAAKLRKRAGA